MLKVHVYLIVICFSGGNIASLVGVWSSLWNFRCHSPEDVFRVCDIKQPKLPVHSSTGWYPVVIGCRPGLYHSFLWNMGKNVKHSQEYTHFKIKPAVYSILKQWPRCLAHVTWSTVYMYIPAQTDNLIISDSHWVSESKTLSQKTLHEKKIWLAVFTVDSMRRSPTGMRIAPSTATKAPTPAPAISQVPASHRQPILNVHLWQRSKERLANKLAAANYVSKTSIPVKLHACSLDTSTILPDMHYLKEIKAQQDTSSCGLRVSHRLNHKEMYRLPIKRKAILYMDRFRTCDPL